MCSSILLLLVLAGLLDAYTLRLNEEKARLADVRDPSLSYKTFRSPPVVLKSGQIANTRADKTPMPFLPTAVAVRHFSSRIIDEKGDDVEMDEVYVHHWLIYNMSGSNGGMCPNLPNIWGIGAELKNVVYDYPAPYAVVTSGAERWGANLHFIRTSNVKNVQDCIECRCPDSAPPLHPHGEVKCCVDGTQCFSMENSTLHDEKTYFLEYTVGYTNITEDTIPLTLFSLDVTATATSDCMIQYDVPSLGENETHTLTSDSVVPSDMNVTFVEAHQHIGGLNFSIEHFRNGEKIDTLCETSPVYSDSGPDKGHLVDIPTCLYPASHPYTLKKGDVLHLSSVYGARTVPGGYPWHAGVMGLVFMAAHTLESTEQQCLQALHTACGYPVYPSNSECLGCAEKVQKQLESAGCTVQMVKDECAKNNDGGNIPAPDEVKGITLHITNPPSGEKGKQHVVLTCPYTAAAPWCGIGFNMAGNPTMQGSVAWTWSADSSGKPGLQARDLGNQNPGNVTEANYPHSFVVNGSSVTISFDISSPKFLLQQNFKFESSKSASEKSTINANEINYNGHVGYARVCILFAQGDAGVLAYHGSARGFTCVRTG